MAENSKIEWCDHTFNCWWGCMKVSEGCKFCYASVGRGSPYFGKDAPRKFMADSTWKKPVTWNAQAWVECLTCGWRGNKKEWEVNHSCPGCIAGIDYFPARQRVFCGSMCDVFEQSYDIRLTQTRNRLYELIEATPNLDWLLLTKRPENVMGMVWLKWYSKNGGVWPDNAWIGTSVANQDDADKNIPELLKIPAKIRFLSCEPLLGDIDLGMGVCLECGGAGETCGHYFSPDGCGPCESCGGSGDDDSVFVDWVIAGAETGPKARLMNPDWSRSLRDQCKQADVSFFFKQMSKKTDIPSDLFIREFPGDKL